MTAVAKTMVKYQNAIVDDYTIMLNSNTGISSSVFEDILIVSGISKKFLAENIFDISVKTMTRYQQDDKKLNARLSETALKCMNLLIKGTEVFGEIDAFTRWLKKPAYGLGDKVPLDLLNTITGIDLVVEELIRIEFGVLA